MENKGFEICSLQEKAWNCTSLRLHLSAVHCKVFRLRFRPAVQTFCRRAAKLTLLNVHVLILAAYMYFAVIIFSPIL